MQQPFQRIQNVKKKKNSLSDKWWNPYDDRKSPFYCLDV